jgi:uncharacterized protein YkwD
MKTELYKACVILLLGSILATFLLAKNSCELTPDILPYGATDVNETATWKRDLIILHNEYRAENDVPLLIENEILNEVAKEKAYDMLENCYWDHFRDNFETSEDVFEDDVFVSSIFAKRKGYDYLYYGENLGRNADTVSRLFQEWIHSQTHKDNILDLHYTEIGIYTYPDTYKCKNLKFNYLTVVVFGTRIM